jgi:hypothetical protein
MYPLGYRIFLLLSNTNDPADTPCVMGEKGSSRKAYSIFTVMGKSENRIEILNVSGRKDESVR